MPLSAEKERWADAAHGGRVSTRSWRLWLRAFRRSVEPAPKVAFSHGGGEGCLVGGDRLTVGHDVSLLVVSVASLAKRSWNLLGTRCRWDRHCLDA